MDVVIRPSRAGDGDALARIHERCWRISYRGLADPAWVLSRPFAERAAEWERFATGAGLPMWVADTGRRVVGGVAAGRSRDAHAPPGTGEVAVLYVDPGHHRHGIGSALLARALAELRARGFVRATLWTLRENPQSTAFYGAQGWRRDGAEKAKRGVAQARYVREL